MATAKAPAGGFDLKNIRLTKEQQNILIVAVVLVGGITYAYINFLFQPNVTAIKAKTQQLQQKSKDLQDARQMAGSYAEFVKKAEFINRKVDFINRRLPVDLQISDTIREVTRKATEANIGILNFEPGNTIKKGGYSEIKIIATFETNYGDLGKFITNLGYIERMTSASNIRVTSALTSGSASPNTVLVAMELKIYSFAEGGK